MCNHEYEINSEGMYICSLCEEYPRVIKEGTPICSGDKHDFKSFKLDVGYLAWDWYCVKCGIEVEDLDE